MRRFWVDPEFIDGDKVLFQDNSFHHLVNVSRFREGDEVEVLYGDKEALVVRITEIKKRQAIAQVIGRRSLAAIARPHIHLVLGLPKPQTLDLIVEKAVELGSFAIHPVYSDFSQKHYKSERIRKIIKSATEQTGRSDLMICHDPVTLKDLLKNFNQNPSTVGLFLYEGQSPLSIKSALKDKEMDKLNEIWLYIGSEGGFSHEEVGLFKAKGLNPISFGNQILRVETACVAVLAVLKYLVSA
jgi:16S rRNA (uracil1498-N3)-methyltransferase